MVAYVNISAAADQVLERLVEGLEIEFGRGAASALAARFLEAEESDFVWDARVCERWLGAWEHGEDADGEFDRVALVGRLDGRWFAAVSIVDGEGHAQGLVARRDCASEGEARAAYASLR